MLSKLVFLGTFGNVLKHRYQSDISFSIWSSSYGQKNVCELNWYVDSLTLKHRKEGSNDLRIELS